MSSAGNVRGRAAGMRGAAVVLGGCLVAFGAMTGVASAHVVVSPGSAAPGSGAELTFRVPDEEATAATTRIDMLIPTDHPIAQLLVRPVPGWTAKVRTVKLARPIVTDDGSIDSAVSEVIWSGGRILPGQYQDFSVTAHPLPSGVPQVVFRTLQTYSNGDVVRWIDVARPGQPEPEHPAPVLKLTSDDAVTVHTTAAPVTGDGGDGLSRGLGIAGLAAGLLGLAAGLRSRRRVRRS